MTRRISIAFAKKKFNDKNLPVASFYDFRPCLERNLHRWNIILLFKVIESK